MGETGLNRRDGKRPETGLKRRLHILVAFPDERFETVVVQWEQFRPTLFVQLKYSPTEPLQFPKLRPNVPGNADLPDGLPLEFDHKMVNFVDPMTGMLFDGEPFNADILFSKNAFTAVQPEPDMVMPPDSLWECRGEALSVSKIEDVVGGGTIRETVV